MAFSYQNHRKMSLFPSPFLAKLQDLKLWQGNYEALLQNKSSEINNPSDFDTIDGLSALDSTRSSVEMNENHHNVDWDKKVLSPSKPFEQILEEKLAEDVPVVFPAKPKKPFLKKGAGLTKYRMTFPQANKAAKSISKKLSFHKTPVTKNEPEVPTKISPRHRNCFKNVTPRNTENSLSSFSATPLKMPDVGIKPKAVWVKVQQNDGDVIQTFSKSHKIENSNDKNNVNRISEFGMRHLLPNILNKNGFITETPEKSSKQHLPPTQLKPQLENTQCELQIFEALEERLEHSSFSSTNSSIMRMLSSTPSKNIKQIKHDIPIQLEKNPQEQYTEQVVGNQYQNNVNKIQELKQKQDVLQHFLSNLKYMVDQEEDEVEHSRPKTKLKKILSPDTTLSEDTNTDTRSPTSSSFYTDFENTFKSSIQQNRQDAAINTSFSNKDESVDNRLECQNCTEMKQKLEHLLKELPDIQAEKARVCDFAKDLEKKRDQLNKEMQKMKAKYEKDIEDLRAELEGEKKKFVREKAVFDMYIKESQNRPSKKEREELSLLKKELTDTKELLKLKDTKNGATQARLRNQIKCLEKERDELKTSVDNLQKENSKLNASRRIQRPSEVKMLHEINKNLSKLTEETFKKQLSKSGMLSPISSKDTGRKGSKNEEEIDENEYITTAKLKRKQTPSKTRNSIEKYNNSKDNISTDTDMTNISLEKRYETTFGQLNSPEPRNNSFNESKKEKVETIFPDGSKQVQCSNGNTKITSPDGNFITVRYYNGDIKEKDMRKNILKYYYAESSTWHTQFGDGSELLEYANGQKEKKYKDGKKEINCPDGTFLTKFPDGAEEILYPDGSKIIKNLEGEKILLLPNGQKEFHTENHKRREYPDGTVKILYADGTQETRYASGRIRIKDVNGVLIMDSNG